jgi:prepilin-type processing-associated H-X9-DG protein
LLVVVAIIALLLSILLPALGAARAQARTVVCQSNVRQLCMGTLAYADDHEDKLPGSTNDYFDVTTGKRPPNHPGYPVDYTRYRSLDWLGTIGETGSQLDDVPRRGTIFRYVGENEAVYKCPEDKLDVVDSSSFGQMAIPTKYSYTAPSLLSGATMSMFESTWWADGFSASDGWTQWRRNTLQGPPWLILEEHELEALAYVTDSAWGNEDTLTDRHQGRAMIGHMDGHAAPRKFQRGVVTLDAWRVYYHLTDGRIVSCRFWYDLDGNVIVFDYLRNGKVAGVLH